MLTGVNEAVPCSRMDQSLGFLILIPVYASLITNISAKVSESTNHTLNHNLAISVLVC